MGLTHKLKTVATLLFRGHILDSVSKNIHVSKSLPSCLSSEQAARIGSELCFFIYSTSLCVLTFVVVTLGSICFFAFLSKLSSAWLGSTCFWSLYLPCLLNSAFFPSRTCWKLLKRLSLPTLLTLLALIGWTGFFFTFRTIFEIMSKTHLVPFFLVSSVLTQT